MSVNEHLALFLEPNSHFLDHLGVFCSLFDIPALFSDSALKKVASKYYPDLKTTLISPSQLNMTSLPGLAKNIYVPLYRYSKDFVKLAPGLFEKRPRFIYVPHGFSHKIQESDIADHAHLDDFFVHGRLESELFERSKIKPSKIYLGDFRHHFYERRKLFYDKIIQEEIFDHIHEKRIFLYAPTWQDPRAPTLFFDVIDRLLQSLPKNIALIIKPHPLLYRYSFSQMLQLEQKIYTIKNVILLDDYPLVLPILKKIDALITDHSSIGYDFLPFNKPLYFLIDKNSNKSKLHSCGKEIPLHQLASIFQNEQTNPKFDEAKALYENVYHKWENLDEFIHQMETQHFSN